MRWAGTARVGLPGERDKIMRDGVAIAEAGAFSLVIEGVAESLARELTAAVAVPTIGIGGSPACERTLQQFAQDSPLEGSGFELSVPRQPGGEGWRARLLIAWACVPASLCSRHAWPRPSLLRRKRD